MKPRRRLEGLLVALFLISVATAGTAFAKQPSLEVRLLAANKLTIKKQREVQTLWRECFDDLGNLQQLKSLGAAIASFDEKLAQGTDIFNQTSNATSRMSQLLSQYVVDERELLQLAQTTYEGYQDWLIRDSVAIYVDAGVDRKTAESLFVYPRFDYTPPQTTLDPLLAKAQLLAESDWFRSGAIILGSGLAAGAFYDDSEQSGWWGALRILAADAAIEMAAEYATDPSERFAQELSREWEKAERVLLEGKQGLFPALKKLTEWHIATRKKHLLPTQKGGK